MMLNQRVVALVADNVPLVANVPTGRVIFWSRARRGACRDMARPQNALDGGAMRRLAVLRPVRLRGQTLAETVQRYLWFLTAACTGFASVV